MERFHSTPWWHAGQEVNGEDYGGFTPTGSVPVYMACHLDQKMWGLAITHRLTGRAGDGEPVSLTLLT
jgi:hypothetical protein